jgi:glycosyltransferase involved in cell wall biosynthesis
MGAMGRKVVEDRFDIERVAAAYEKIYADLVGENLIRMLK